jgi:uncharacterized protein
MIVHVAKIPFEGKRFEGEEPAAILEIDGDKDIHPDGPIRYDLQVQVVSDELIAMGKLRMPVSFRCSRCGEPFPLSVADTAFTCAREFHDPNESIDLTGDIREAILLAFPSYPLCKDDCKGLCTRCGTNLNRNKCTCEPPADFRWSALNNLEMDSEQAKNQRKDAIR